MLTTMVDTLMEWLLIGLMVLLSPFWIPVALLGCAVQVLYYGTVLLTQMVWQMRKDG